MSPMSPSLFACGSNGAGQLALGHAEDVSCFTACRFDPSCGDITAIDDLVSSASHCLLLVTTDTGKKVLGAGTNSHSQLGRKCALSDSPKAMVTFRPISFGAEARVDGEPTKIAATWTTSFVVYSNGDEEKVVACGSNDFGELGISPGLASGPIVIDIGLKKGERVQHLCGGQRHVIAVVSNGESQRVMGWGAARRGELSATPQMVPTSAKGKGKAPARPSTLPPTAIDLAIPPNSTIVSLSLGASHSLALLSNGRVLAWGNDAKGQISNIHTAENVISIGCTWGGSYLLIDGNVWSQGSNTHGQLLRPAPSPDHHRARVPLDRNADGLCVGTEHLMVAASRLYTGGWNEHGNLGLGDTQDRSTLTPVDLDGTVRAMWGGCATTWVLLEHASRSP